MELDGALSPFLVVFGDLAKPSGTHVHMCDFIGQHVVLAERQNRIGGFPSELSHLSEHVDRQALQTAIHSSKAKRRIVVASGLEQRGRLDIFSELTTHVFGQLDRDLTMPGFVPALAGHVKLQLEWHLIGVEVECGAACPFKCLNLTYEDAVHAPTSPLAYVKGVSINSGNGRSVSGVLEALLSRLTDESSVTSELGGIKILTHCSSLPQRGTLQADCRTPIRHWSIAAIRRFGICSMPTGKCLGWIITGTLSVRPVPSGLTGPHLQSDDRLMDLLSPYPPGNLEVMTMANTPADSSLASGDRADASAEPERVFSSSIIISGIRCVLTYLIFPFVAPLVGLAPGVGAGFGLVIGVFAIAANLFSIRRFWRADHRLKVPVTVLHVAVILLLVFLAVRDILELTS